MPKDIRYKNGKAIEFENNVPITGRGEKRGLGPLPSSKASIDNPFPAFAKLASPQRGPLLGGKDQSIVLPGVPGNPLLAMLAKSGALPMPDTAGAEEALMAAIAKKQAAPSPKAFVRGLAKPSTVAAPVDTAEDEMGIENMPPSGLESGEGVSPELLMALMQILGDQQDLDVAPVTPEEEALVGPFDEAEAEFSYAPEDELVTAPELSAEPAPPKKKGNKFGSIMKAIIGRG